MGLQYVVVHIVEDDEAVADALAMALEDLDHRPRTYPDGETFLARARIATDDWVFVDLGLPGRSGADVIRDLLDSGQPPNIVAISGKSRTNLLRQLRELPDLKVLRKPLSIEMISDAMG